MTHIEELTFVVTGLSLNQYKELIRDFQKSKILYTEVGLIDGIALITLNEIFMPTIEDCENYINSLNFILNKWKDFEPYFDEGSIKN
jgi:hypothetical protein